MIKFGTGGWRAVIGDDFTRENIQKLSKALVNKMKDEGVAEQGVAIGYDRRFLSKESAIKRSNGIFMESKRRCLKRPVSASALKPGNRRFASWSMRKGSRPESSRRSIL